MINRGDHYDARNDLGYGRISAKFHKSRSFDQYATAPIEDEEAEGVISDETYDAVLQRLLNYAPSDSLAKYGTDPFYFVGAATKLKESTAKGMVPFPKMYSQRQAVSGGTAQRLPAGPTLGFRSRIRPTGTKKGYSQAPYPSPLEANIGDSKYSLDQILNTNHDEEHLEMLRNIISLIHKQQQTENIPVSYNNYQ
jgi:hypothetical protein